MLLDSRGVKSELTLPNSSVHYFNFNPSLWLAEGFRSLSAKLKHGDLSQATVIGVFSPELATIGKDMVVYALDGRKGDGAILSKDKAVRGRGVEPLDYGSASGEDLLYQSSDSLSENGFKESALRVVSYFKVSNPSTALWGDNSNTTLFIGTLPPLAVSVRISRPRSSVMLPSGDMPLSLLCSAGCLHPMSAEKWRAIWR